MLLLLLRFLAVRTFGCVFVLIYFLIFYHGNFWTGKMFLVADIYGDLKLPYRKNDFTIGWKMPEIGQLVEVDSGALLFLCGLVRMARK